MAQDKRHDLTKELIEYWAMKLSGYSDEEVCRALMAHSGRFFPSVDEVARLILAARQPKPKPARSEFVPCRENGCQDGWIHLPAEKCKETYDGETSERVPPPKIGRVRRCACFYRYKQELGGGGSAGRYTPPGSYTARYPSYEERTGTDD